MKVKNILISQPKPSTEKSPYFDMEGKYGVHFHFHQFIRIEGLTSKEFRAQHISILDYTAIIFSSRLGVDHFFGLCEELRITMPDTMHYYCTTEAIANYLQKYIQFRKRKVFFSAGNKMSDLLPIMQRHPEDKFLLVASDVYSDDIIQMFTSHQLDVRPAIMYRTVPNVFSPEERLDYDMYVLFTPMGVVGFQQNYPDFEQGERIIACYGAATAKAMKEANMRVDIEAPSKEYPSITSAIDAFLKENHKRTR